MLWIQHPRTCGFLISLPAVPAMILTLLWVLEPSDPSSPPTVRTGTGSGLVEGHEQIRRTLGLRDTTTEADARPMTPAAAEALVSSAVVEDGREPMRRIGMYRDGRQVGWVAACPDTLASVAASHLEDMARQADEAREASLVARERFAEAHELSLANRDQRAHGGQRYVREQSDLVRLSRGLADRNTGPRFERPEFVDAVARDRAETRRASNRSRSPRR